MKLINIQRLIFWLTSIDISISSVLDTSSSRFKQGVSTTIDLQFSVDNTGNNVPAAASPNTIYSFFVKVRFKTIS